MSRRRMALHREVRRAGANLYGTGVEPLRCLSGCEHIRE